jgi:hypothetical protein
MNKIEIDKNQIVNELYKKYYLTDETPENLVSSHWKHYHKMIKLDFSDEDKIKPLIGVGFGDLQDKSKAHNLIKWLTILSYLVRLPDKINLLRLIRTAIPLAKRMGFIFSYDCFRQVCVLNLIIKEMKDIGIKGKRLNVINIGDGYGFLSVLIKEVIPNSSICLVDLGKTLLFQAYYCNKVHPKCSHALVLGDELDQTNCDFIYCPAEHIEELSARSFDIAINIASMQEMNQNTIKTYFDFLRRRMSPENLFYCCNRERKEMPGGEVSDFFQYPWHKKDLYKIDAPCPWHRYFFAIKSGSFKVPLPAIKYFDGVHRHRLTVLYTHKGE